MEQEYHCYYSFCILPCKLCPVQGHLAEAVSGIWNQPTLHSSSCVPWIGKHSPGGKVAFFPIHTETQYGLAAVPFFFKTFQNTEPCQIVSGLILKDRNWRGLCFDSLLAMTCGASLIQIPYTCCSFYPKCFSLRYHSFTSLGLCPTITLSLRPSLTSIFKIATTFPNILYLPSLLIFLPSAYHWHTVL